MLPEKKTKNIYLKCRKCGAESKKGPQSLKLVEQKKRLKGVIILEKNPIPLPITDQECEKCRHKKAYYWLQQTRSADEPPTQFFRCVRCQHVWREYK